MLGNEYVVIFNTDEQQYLLDQYDDACNVGLYNTSMNTHKAPLCVTSTHQSTSKMLEELSKLSQGPRTFKSKSYESQINALLYKLLLKTFYIHSQDKNSGQIILSGLQMLCRWILVGFWQNL